MPTMKSAGIVTLLLAASTHHLPTVCGLTTLPPSRGVSSSVRPSSPMQSRRLALASLSTAALALLTPTSSALAEDGGAKQRRKLQRYPSIRFISALGDPTASSGDSGAESWGLWRDDPGPRGVYLRDYDRRIGSNDDLAAPAGWKFDPSDWWVEEHGLIMSTPEPLPRKSLDRETRAIVPEKKVRRDGGQGGDHRVDGAGKWELGVGEGNAVRRDAFAVSERRVSGGGMRAEECEFERLSRETRGGNAGD
mmetsp:Transcript_5662/g.12335  ORF Transcript_5662/g.12335 Transcript_5662/m.12335 type:complete len:250 (+) Transcript_5662:73-822(+)